MQKLAQVAPSSVWRHQAAAEADESQGSYSLAITEYRQVLALEPDRPGVHYRLGRTLWRVPIKGPPPRTREEARRNLSRNYSVIL